MIYIYIYFIFTTFFVELVEAAKPFKRPSSSECSKKSSIVKSIGSIKSSHQFNKEGEIIDASEAYAGPQHCNFTMIAPKLIINPYRMTIQNLVQEKPFGSFHVKCAACLAVAEQVEIY